MKELYCKWIVLVGLFVMTLTCNAQTIIQMEEYGGVYRIPCKVNGAKMKLIFDTGADKVCLSLSMAEYLFDNDFLSKNDIKGSGSSTVADGSIVDHIKIILKDIEIQGMHLRNVEAVVIDGQNAPLLLGQSAIKKLGVYSISGNKLIIGGNAQPNKTTMSEADVERLLDEAKEAGSNGYYRVAIEKYTALHNFDLLQPLDMMSYASCHIHVDEYSKALDILQTIQPTIESEYPMIKDILYDNMGTCYEKTGDYHAALLNFEKAKYYSETYSYSQVLIVYSIANVYETQGYYYKSKRILDDYISNYLYDKNIKATDCWLNSSANIDSHDKFILADLFYKRALANDTYNNDCEKYMIIAAAWGSWEAIDWCKKNHINFLKKPSDYRY